MTRWRDEEAYQAWERWRAAREPRPTVRRVSDAPGPAAFLTDRGEPIKPVAYSEYWSFEVADGPGAGAS